MNGADTSAGRQHLSDATAWTGMELDATALVVSATKTQATACGYGGKRGPGGETTRS